MSVADMHKAQLFMSRGENMHMRETRFTKLHFQTLIFLQNGKTEGSKKASTLLQDNFAPEAPTFDMQHVKCKIWSFAMNLSILTWIMFKI